MARWRLRPRFSLATLLALMTVLSAGLGSVALEWRDVQERQTVLDLIHALQFQSSGRGPQTSVTIEPTKPSWIARLLGEESDFAYAIIDLSPELRARTAAAFPEAEFEQFPRQ